MRKVTKIENENLNTIGKRITFLRTNAGMSQEELADKLDMKRQKLSYIENDTPNRQITVDELTKLCRIFNTSSDYILGLSNAKNMDNVSISKEFGFDDEAINSLNKLKDKLLVKQMLNFIIKEEQLIKLFTRYFCIAPLNDLFINRYPALSVELGASLFESKYCYAEIIETLPKILLKISNILENDTTYMYEYIHEIIKDKQDFNKMINALAEEDHDDEFPEGYFNRTETSLDFIDKVKKYFIDNNLDGLDYLTDLEDELTLKSFLYKGGDITDGNTGDNKKQEV